MDINFELYKIFYHAARSESFSQAARQLFITQSAISQGIKNLETRLGVRLFFRHGRSAQLTPEGQLLFSHICQAYNFIKTAEQKVSEFQTFDSGEVRIGASDTVCKYYLLPYLRQFTENFPKITIRVVNRTSPQILENLRQGSIDFGIVTFPVEAKGVRWRELTAVQDIWVAAPKFAALREGPIPFSALAAYPLLLLEKTSATRRNLDAFLQERQLAVVPEIELESVDLLVEFAKIGLGVAHVLGESAHAALETGELFEVRTDIRLPRRQLAVASLENVPLSRAAGRFIQSLTKKVPEI